MLNITFVGDRELVSRLTSMPVQLQAALLRKTHKLAFILEAKVKRKLSGEVLNVRTGALRRSIHSKVESGPGVVTGKVYSSGDVKYAGIHEFGGTIKHPGGTPYMNFEGKTFFVSKAKAANLNLPKTRAHDIVMPQRSFLRSSLAEMRDQIQYEYREAVVEVVRGR